MNNVNINTNYKIFNASGLFTGTLPKNPLPILVTSVAVAAITALLVYIKKILYPQPTPQPAPSLPAIPNGVNTCFLASLTHTFLANNPPFLEALTRAVEETSNRLIQADAASAESLTRTGRLTSRYRSAQTAAHEDTQKRGLVLLRDYLNLYQQHQQTKTPIPIEETRRLREAIFLLGGLDYPVNNEQHDVSEIMGIFINAVLPYLTPEQKTELLGITQLGTYRYVDPPGIPDVVPVNPIPPHENEETWGKIDLAITPNKSLQQLVREYFVSNHEDQLPTDRPYVLTDTSVGPINCTIREARIRFNQTPPANLVISLKRFTNEQDKIGTPIIGINPTLSLPADYVENPPPNRRADHPYLYQLHGVIIHHGEELKSGHYTALKILTDKAGKRHYIEANDETIQPISSADFNEKSQSAYMLFYTRVNEESPAQARGLR